MVLIPVVSFAQSSTPASSPASIPASQPSSGSSVSTASVSTGGSSSTATPSTGGSTSTASPSTPSSGGSSSTATPSTGGSSSTAIPFTPPTPTPTPSTGGGSSSSSGSYSSSGGRVNFAYMYGCPMITSFMKYGANNDSAQVTKLQSFLKNIEKLDVDVTGYFDKKTEYAVIAFQNKYNPTIMGPWGATKGTGFVYITTVKQINKITCSLPLTLNPSELSIINATRNAKVATAKPVIIVPKETPTPVEIEVSATEDNTITFESENQTNEGNTATVGKAGIMSRFWDFMVYLFK